MKRLIITAIVAIGFTLFLPSCTNDAGDNCKYCYTQTTDADGNVLSTGTPEETCGSDLDAIDGTTDTDADNNTVTTICDAAYRK